MPSAGEAARISSAAQSDVGRSRTENQDAFGEFRTNVGERLFVVADGMGGHRGGATASRLCVETVGRVFASEPGAAEARLAAAFQYANSAVREAALADPELGGMGTTVVALAIDPSGAATLGWVGDSRAYVFRDGSLDLLSRDHSVVAEMVRAGSITPEEAESHPRRNELMRAIGPREELEPETLAFTAMAGDRFLLCSDGLWGCVPEPEIAVTLGFEAPELAVRKLVVKANDQGGPDNITVMIVRLAEPVSEIAAAPAEVGESAPAAPRRSLAALLGSAAAVASALIVLALVALRDQRRGELNLVAEHATAEVAAAPAQAEAPPPEAGQAEAPPDELAKAEAAKAEAAKAQAAKAEAARAEAARAQAAKLEAERAVAARAEAAAQAEAARAEQAAVAKVEAYKRAEAARLAAAKAEAAKPAAPKPAAAPLEPPELEPAASAAAAPVAARSPATQIAAPTPDVAAAPPAAEPAPLAALPAAAPLQQAQVEKFLGDWEAAIQSKDFALYSSLGLPDDAQEFRSRYVDKDARLDFSLQDVQRADADKLLLRVQMVFESRDRTGVKRVERERRFLVQETSNGLRYAGTPKK